ncbi:hydroxyethylthiazole kinase [Telmatospirillum siberiense]|uniref:Hydroxyethylthiazole kinase n=1 Tax=Telmatospirillum siberiense TaxID=382514 RepID=A0A2N3PWC7_9PROT|nr:hydroxyethylthiazole kinase [Telmatospirillum siberiense]PKU24700.1 hydroxyethylthiazole kinase [Telmatospirillum siberiense]
MNASDLWPLVLSLRERAPLVQCITNFVAMDVTANVLLAAGASPAMVHATEEVADFVQLGGTLSINMGTPSPDWVEGMMAAVSAAQTRGTSWVLDPVAVGATPYRNAVAAGLLSFDPTVIRGNAGEIMTLAGRTCVTTKGVDSTQTAATARDAAIALAAERRCVVAATGEVDIVTDGRRLIVLGNGHPLMTKVTALGCSLSALIAAFLAVSDDPWAATAAATAYFGVCGELAAEGAAGPASLRIRLIDLLYSLDAAAFDQRLKVMA